MHGPFPVVIPLPVIDTALGNTDNHARNIAVLKRSDSVALSPIYDLAPMALDPRGIARVCRWEDNAPYPDWNRVAETLAKAFARAVDGPELRRWLRHLAAPVAELAVTMRSEGVPARVTEQCEGRIAQVAKGLAQVSS